MKSILTSPFNAISSSVHSHRAAQAVIYADQLKGLGIDVDIDYGNKLNYDDYDTMYVYHGNDFSGVLNMFGGVKDFAGIDRIIEFSKFKGEIISLAIPMPDYSQMLLGRLDGNDKANPKWKNVDWTNLKRLPDTWSIDQHYLNYGNEITLQICKTDPEIVIGDSHAISLYKPGVKMNSIPFKTLHGALNDGLIEQIVDKHIGLLPKVTLYFGNIDIRHHLARQPNPFTATKLLAKQYVDTAISLLLRNKASVVQIMEPLPIENVSRQIPKTGWYKGTPYYGSWAQRNELRDTFIEEMERIAPLGVKINRWTYYLTNKQGELDFQYMEKPRSVHLSRAAYPRWTGLEEEPSEDLTFHPVVPLTVEKIGIEGFFDD